MFIGGMTVTLQFDFLQICSFVHLVTSPQLMMSNDIIIWDFLPAGSTEKMLGLDAWIAEEIVIGYHGHELGSGHGFPAAFANGGVVYEKLGRDDGFESFPVLWEC